MSLLTIGDQFPSYRLTALIPGDLSQVNANAPDDYFTTISSDDHPGKWRVVFFWPKDFTFVCPTEIAAFGKLNDEFADRDAQVLGASVDNEFVHFQWRAQHEDLKTLPFPMLSDIKRELVEATGVLNADGVADRATFIIDPNNEIQFVSVTAGSVGRNVDEVLRVLDALQSDELCACNWKKGDPTLDAGELLKESV
ncbi:peroxiredoxin [Mycolicibacillus parakoreensis]|uniref:Peroxiredoxin n=1 Tax=Mycolicibacillus parakoreensis TaxID=1069221 RepID=A0ABY3U675_9MYCO|nr:peroxiredoxin [Mycolicibacillus parakoreensis]MCV7317518.1 peroxiredoxin [Mycolicibacillus parakoreensis]ULN54232.1 peroxiredoxin [Mycolicibacillus parakoreensis]